MNMDGNQRGEPEGAVLRGLGRAGAVCFNPASVIKPVSILIIDDEPDIREIVSLSLSLRTPFVETVGNRDEALKILRVLRPEIVIMDMFMPGLAAEPFLKEIRNAPKVPEFILMTADPHSHETARRLGIAKVLPKPFLLEDLLRICGF